MQPPPFDPELREAAAVLAEQMRSSLTLEEIVAARAASASAMPSNEDIGRRGTIHIEERTVPSGSGTPDVPLLLCRPAAAVGRLPVIYFMHGGGMVVGTNRFGIDYLLDWVQELNVALVSVEYRLAPENPYPAALDDCFAGMEWVAENAEQIGIDPEQIIVAGASAGGGLAAALCLLTRDRKGPQPFGQMLLSPMLDDRDATSSAHQMQGIGLWDRTTNQIAWGHFLGDKFGGDEVSAYAAPARAEDLSGLPPTFLDVGSAETFRDEVVGYASGIWRAGGAAELHVWPGGFHGFELFVPGATLSQDTLAARVRWLNRLRGAQAQS
jgi:acetyl esterase/lipase